MSKSWRSDLDSRLPVGASFWIVALAGCGASTPEVDDLGTFQIEAELLATTCGEDALGTQPELSFEMALERDERTRELIWDRQGNLAFARLEPDGRGFRFEDTVRVDLTAERGEAPCRVARHDTLEGTLSTAERPSGLAATLSYAFEALDPAGCDEFAHERAGVAALPCQIEYSTRGTRIDAGSGRVD